MRELPPGRSALPQVRTEIPGPHSRALAARLARAESPNVTYLADDFPVFWESASGCLVTDADGNVFLDMTAAFGVAGVGHSHPDVVAAVHAQADKLLHGMGDVHPSAIKVALCERVAGLVPMPEAQIILSQNGSDAIEAALKTAALATGKRGVLAFEGGYHGLSYGALDVTARADFRGPFLPQLGQFTTHLPFGAARDVLERELATGRYGAVVAEPIQGRGGIVVPPDGWLSELRELTARFKVLLILDEIFTGWGRTGTWFACQQKDVIPDILCVGKAMGGGLPLSAAVASRALMACWGKSRGEALHTSTFLGNPLACAAALAALTVLERENLPARAAQVGDEFAGRLRQLQSRHPQLLTDVRGRGLMLGLQTRSPEIARRVMLDALRRGLIILPAGDGSVLEFVPPLVVSSAQISWCLDTLDAILRLL